MDKLQWNFSQNMKLFNHENASENIVCDMAAIFEGEMSSRPFNTPTTAKRQYNFLLKQAQWPLLLTWFNFNPGMDK